jgi:hypothetical protein
MYACDAESSQRTFGMGFFRLNDIDILDFGKLAAEQPKTPKKFAARTPKDSSTKIDNVLSSQLPPFQERNHKKGKRQEFPGSSTPETVEQQIECGKTSTSTRKDVRSATRRIHHTHADGATTFSSTISGSAAGASISTDLHAGTTLPLAPRPTAASTLPASRNRAPWPPLGMSAPLPPTLLQALFAGCSRPHTLPEPPILPGMEIVQQHNYSQRVCVFPDHHTTSPTPSGANSSHGVGCSTVPGAVAGAALWGGPTAQILLAGRTLPPINAAAAQALRYMSYLLRCAEPPDVTASTPHLFRGAAAAGPAPTPPAWLLIQSGAGPLSPPSGWQFAPA